MREIKKCIQIAEYRNICDFCLDCGNDDVCIKCEKVKPIPIDELRNFHTTVVQALQEKLVREYPKPLTLEGLRWMEGEPVWVETMQEWRIVCIGCENDIRLYSIFNIISAKHVIDNDGRIYRYKPEHIGDATNMVEGE